MKASYCFAILFVIASGVSANVYKDCGSVLSKIDSVTISGCDGSKPECTLKRDTNVTINVTLVPSAAVNSINTVVHGIMMGMPVPFPLDHPNACENTGLTCPLKPEETYHYSASFPVLKTYPKVKVDVKWELQDEEKKDLICLLIPAKIQ